MKKIGSSLAFIFLSAVPAFSQADSKTLLFIPDSHLDTQWNWDVETSINEYVKNTLRDNLSLMEKYPNFRFNFEGAIRYKWMKEYYPTDYARLQAFIDAGRWNIAGCAVDANDVMVSSAESIIRNWLYGSVYYKTEFGVRGGHDIMLPDCFGFPYSLPSLASHCGMTGFHTAKLSWGSRIYDSLPPFGLWQGVDGSQIYAVYKPHAYDSHEEYNKDMANDADMARIISENYNRYGVAAEVRYVGPRSDRGGSLQDNAGSSGENTPYWLNYSVSSRGPVNVKLATPDEVFDYLALYKNDKYQIHNDELPMRVHGVGSYTSQAVLKRWNRRNELLADAAEKASVAAEWLGASAYPSADLRTAWMNNLWQAHHDGLTGTSIPKAYVYSHNEYALANKTFGDAFVNAAGAFAAALDTRVEGKAIVLYNPLSFERKDVAEVQIVCASRPADVRVIGPDGKEVLAQVSGYDTATSTATIAFAATVPSLGYAVYDVRPGEKCTLTSDLYLDKNTMQISNGSYRYGINANGDCNIYDLKNSRLLMGYVSLVMFDDVSDSWPAWEITYETVAGNVKATVDENVEISIAEDGPLRKSVRVSRQKNGSRFVHYIIVNALNDRVDMVNEVDWNSYRTLLKLNVPLRSSATQATYDLSLGTITRGLSTSQHYEMQGHQWADVECGDAGVSVINDSKYGWDMPKGGNLRLSLIHTPKANNYSYQQLQDIGDHHFTVAFFPHKGRWGAPTQQQAAMLNQPLMAFEAPGHDGPMGKQFAFASLNTPDVAIKALKKAELTEEYIVRAYELTGEDRSDVKIEFPAAIMSVREVNGLEEDMPESPTVNVNGKTMTFNIGHYSLKTFAVRLASPAVNAGTVLPTSSYVNLDYDTDVMSGENAISDVTRGIVKAFPAELMSDNITANDITFAIGSRDAGANNALSCHGQKLNLNRGKDDNKLYVLAISTEPAGSEASFTLGDEEVTFNVPYYGGYVGQAKSAFNFGAEYRRDEVAFTATHNHNASTGKNETFSFLYIYKYAMELPEGVDEIVLPDSKGLYLIAATLSNNNHDDVRVASDVHTYPAPDELSFEAMDFGEGRLYPEVVTASGFVNNSESPAKANDGDSFTKWCCTSPNGWLEYRFNKDVVVDRWALLNGAIEGLDKVTSDFTIQYYDGKTWKQISSVSGNTDNYVSQSINPVTARRFRLQVNVGEQGGGKTARIYEFALYGHYFDASGIENVTSFTGGRTIELHGDVVSPGSGEAEVHYTLPEGMTEVALKVYDITGKLIKVINLPVYDGNPGKYTTSVTFDMNRGVYLYHLAGTCDGSPIQSNSKKILIK